MFSIVLWERKSRLFRSISWSCFSRKELCPLSVSKTVLSQDRLHPLIEPRLISRDLERISAPSLCHTRLPGRRTARPTSTANLWPTRRQGICRCCTGIARRRMVQLNCTDFGQGPIDSWNAFCISSNKRAILGKCLFFKSDKSFRTCPIIWLLSYAKRA